MLPQPAIPWRKETTTFTRKDRIRKGNARIPTGENLLFRNLVDVFLDEFQRPVWVINAGIRTNGFVACFGRYHFDVQVEVWQEKLEETSQRRQQVSDFIFKMLTDFYPRDAGKVPVIFEWAENAWTCCLSSFSFTAFVHNICISFSCRHKPNIQVD